MMHDVLQSVRMAFHGFLSLRICWDISADSSYADTTGPLGVPGVLWLQCITCVLGAVVSTAYLKHDWEYEPSPDNHSFRRSHISGSLEVAWPVVD